MKTRVSPLQRIVPFFFLLTALSVTIAAQNRSSISGMVFEAQTRQPLTDLYVELLDEFGMSLRRTRVESSGRFAFYDLSNGNFKVRVLTHGTNYREETKDAALGYATRDSRFGSDIVYLEFYLRLDPRKNKDRTTGSARAVFAQEVPEAALKLYKKADQQLKDKNNEGLETLKQAIEIFPTYYDALDRLGNEYVRRSEFTESAPYLIRAIDVNQRSFTSFYALGIVGYELKDLKAASDAFRAATIIDPQSPNAQAWYGKVLRLNGDYEAAEKALLAAKSLLPKNSQSAEIHWQLALLYEKTARYKEAANQLELYLTDEPKARDAEKIKKLIQQLRAKAG